MEKYHQGKQRPYLLQVQNNAPPPSYDQVYGGVCGHPIITQHEPCQSVEYPDTPPAPNGLSNHYCPAPQYYREVQPPVPKEMSNHYFPINLSQSNKYIANNGGYDGLSYPDPRKIASSARARRRNRIQTDEDNEDQSVRIYIAMKYTLCWYTLSIPGVHSDIRL